MKSKALATSLLFILAFLVPAFASQDSDILDAVELVKRVETQYQGQTSHGTLLMTIKTRNWQRSLEMESWSEGRDKMLTRILAPAKERGTCTLKVNDDIWNYIARIDRLIKIPSSLMGDSWMGSHLTNDDLVKENKIDRLYDLKISSQSPEEISITGIPKKDAAVVWGKIIYRLDRKNMLPRDIQYFDEEDNLVRTLLFSDPGEIQGRVIPRKFRIIPVDKPEEYTEIAYGQIEFDIKLDANLFSIKSLRNR